MLNQQARVSCPWDLAFGRVPPPSEGFDPLIAGNDPASSQGPLDIKVDRGRSPVTATPALRSRRAIYGSVLDCARAVYESLSSSPTPHPHPTHHPFQQHPPPPLPSSLLPTPTSASATRLVWPKSPRCLLARVSPDWMEVEEERGVGVGGGREGCSWRVAEERRCSRLKVEVGYLRLRASPSVSFICL